MNRQEMQKKVQASMTRQLHERGYTTSEDTLVDIGMLEKQKLEEWKKGKVRYLEAVCSGNLSKLSYALRCMREYARNKGLKSSYTSYKGKRFTKSGEENLERVYATHYVSPALKKASPSPSQEGVHPQA